MLQLVYWALEPYQSEVARGARDGLVAQSRALLLHEWLGYDGSINGGNGSFSGIGRYVYENYGADTGEGWSYSSSAVPLYHWGALAGFIGMQANGFYGPIDA